MIETSYSDRQIREVSHNMGTSIEMIKRNYTDRKNTGFDVDILLDEPNKNKHPKKNKKTRK